ncbi:hypothetical protein C8F01DRAFT_1180291, partial [Mycena amicta]
MVQPATSERGTGNFLVSRTRLSALEHGYTLIQGAFKCSPFLETWPMVSPGVCMVSSSSFLKLASDSNLLLFAPRPRFLRLVWLRLEATNCRCLSASACSSLRSVSWSTAVQILSLSVPALHHHHVSHKLASLPSNSSRTHLLCRWLRALAAVVPSQFESESGYSGLKSR